MSLTKTITLIGLMGAGKTTIGTVLAKKLGVEFIDSDKVIEEQAGITISEIFARDGEEFFRKVEAKTIADLLTRKPCVLATGGGAFMNEQTRANIKKHSASMWLKASLEVLLERVEHSTARPLLNNANKREILGNLIALRYPIYEQADIVIDTDVNSRTIITDEIMKKLEENNLWKN